MNFLISDINSFIFYTFLLYESFTRIYNTWIFYFYFMDFHGVSRDSYKADKAVNLFKTQICIGRHIAPDLNSFSTLKRTDIFNAFSCEEISGLILKIVLHKDGI